MIPFQEAERLPLLKDLPQDVLNRLLMGAEIVEHPKGHVMFHEGGDPTCMFALLRGVVELYTSRPRNDAVVLFMWPNDIFIPAATLTGQPYLLSGRSLTSVKILQFDADRIEEELRLSHDFATRLLRIVSGQFRRTVRHLKDLKVRTGPQRVAAFMLRLVLAMGKNGYADLPFSKASVASRLGLTPESFSRALHELSDNGLQVRGTRVILTDQEKLEMFCHLDPLIDGSVIA